MEEGPDTPRDPELPEEIVRWEQQRRDRPPTSRWEAPIGRRAFLSTIGAGIGGLVFLSKSSSISRGLSNAAQSLKPGGGWRIYTVASSMPVFDPATFELKVSGLVDNPVTLSWKEVAAMPGRRQVSDFHCVTGWSVERVHYEGITPQHIVDLVRPKREAGFVKMVSAEEPYEDQLTLEQFLHEDNLLAREMDHRPITQEHGAPLRMVIPAMYGYKGVKWVRELHFGAREEMGYWEQRGYDTDAFIGKSNGR